MNDLKDMNYRIFLRDDGTLFIYYDDSMSLDEKNESIKNGSFFVSSLDSINVNKLDLRNIHEISVNFDSVDYEKFDKPEEVYIIPSYVNNSPYFLPISYVKEAEEEANNSRCRY